MTTQDADTMNTETVAESASAPIIAEQPPVTATNAPIRDELLVAEVKSLRDELTSQINWMFGTASIACVALLASLTSPLWSANMGANNNHAVRTMALASAYLGRVTETSRPFPTELALVRLSLPNDAQVRDIVEAIVPLASANVPTMDELNTKIATMASDVFMGRMVGADDTWINSSVSRLASITRIESLATSVVPSYSGEEVALVHEAQALMAKGDLKQAVEKVSKLSGHAAETAASWLGSAKQRLLLNEKVAELTNLALTRASDPSLLVAR